MSQDLHKIRRRKKKLGSYPAWSVIFSTTLALFVMGLFGTLVIYSRELERAVRENIKIQVYLKNQITESQRLQIEKNLASRQFVAKVNPETAIQFISKDEAARVFIKETGEDFKKFLGENPLRDAFIIRIDPAFHDTLSMRKIKNEAEQISGVFEADYVENLIDSINQNVTKIALILITITAILILTVVLLIHNTVRLALFSQRFLIRSMQLVGATRWFIQRPFFYRAALQGLLSALIAALLLAGILKFATDKIPDLSLLQNNERLTILTGSLFIMGMIIATLSTYRAVRKYLGLSLDELY